MEPTPQSVASHSAGRLQNSGAPRQRPVAPQTRTEREHRAKRTAALAMRGSRLGSGTANLAKTRGSVDRSTDTDTDTDTMINTYLENAAKARADQDLAPGVRDEATRRLLGVLMNADGGSLEQSA